MKFNNKYKIIIILKIVYLFILDHFAFSSNKYEKDPVKVRNEKINTPAMMFKRNSQVPLKKLTSIIYTINIGSPIREKRIPMKKVLVIMYESGLNISDRNNPEIILNINPINAPLFNNIFLTF